MNAKSLTCRWCGASHGTHCPLVRALEYHPNGIIKRVEFMHPSDYQTISGGPNPHLKLERKG